MSAPPHHVTGAQPATRSTHNLTATCSTLAVAWVVVGGTRSAQDTISALDYFYKDAERRPKDAPFNIPLHSRNISPKKILNLHP
ncbi:hypothetical protein MTO96_028120 [Rhipicephalus appendiculatus]